MVTVALRYFDKFAPEGGTIFAHQQMINDNGFVYYGKLGTPLSMEVIDKLKKNEDKRFLLIHSGHLERYWVYYTDVTRKQPLPQNIPGYYRNRAEDFKTWFKVIKFERASNDILQHCFVNSSNKPLGEASRHSMSPYFIIRVE